MPQQVPTRGGTYRPYTWERGHPSLWCLGPLWSEDDPHDNLVFFYSKGNRGNGQVWRELVSSPMAARGVVRKASGQSGNAGTLPDTACYVSLPWERFGHSASLCWHWAIYFFFSPFWSCRFTGTALAACRVYWGGGKKKVNKKTPLLGNWQQFSSQLQETSKIQAVNYLVL